MRTLDFPTQYRVQGWGVSLLLHAIVVGLAIIAVAEVKFVPNQNVFQWEVAVVQAPTENTSSTASAEQPPASPVSEPAPAKASSAVATPKPSVTQRIETKQVVESVRPEPTPLVAQPLERQIVERKPVEQVQPVKQREASRVETVTPRPIETPEAYEKKQVVQERREVEDKAVPIATQTPQEVAAVQKQEPVTSMVPHEAAPATKDVATKEIAAVESSQPITKNTVPVEELAPARVDPAPMTQTTAAVESAPLVTREVTPIVKETQPVESRPPTVARTEPAQPVQSNPSSSSPGLPQSHEHVPLDHTHPPQARQDAPLPGAFAKAYATPRADFGWLTQALWRRIEQLKRYPHMARMNRWEGTVVVRCVIRPDGNFSELTMEKSSGHDVLDQDALELLRKASPLSLKHELGRSELTIRIPISYKLE